jgi:hypothetical protein
LIGISGGQLVRVTVVTVPLDHVAAYLIMPYLGMILTAPQLTKEDIDGWLKVWNDVVRLAMDA